MADIRTIVKQDIGERIEKWMVTYAEKTILDRAIPDARDGLKPVHRRVLYAMGELNLLPNAKTLKCARIVGEVLGKYHPHGDSSVYGALVRLAQDWVMGVPLVIGQGNFGSIDGDGAAAMRYTEAKLSEFGALMLNEIDRDTVAFIENFDGTLKEPVVLPARFPNLLVNGTTGIAVGMSTDILPHNLNEVCDAVIYLASNWKNLDKITVDDLMKIIPGPDLPTGGLIYRYRKDEKTGVSMDMIREAYETGYSPLVCQAKADIEKNGRTKIVITEIPYGISKGTILERVAKVKDKLAGKITDVSDESDQEGMRIVFDVARGCDPQEALNALFTNTNLRTTLSVNHLALNIDDEGNMYPEVMSLKALLVAFIKHRLVVITRRARFDKDKAEKRLHIVEALLAALAKIDEVVAIIRGSKDTDTAKTKLKKLLGLDDVQAQAILDMQLRRLVSLEVNKLKEEKKELLAKIKELNEIIGSEAKRLSLIIEDMKEINAKYPTPRKTIIVENENGHKETVTVADLLVPEKPQMVVLTTSGIQRADADTYKDTVQPGKVSARAVEVVTSRFVVEPTDNVVLISNRGRLWFGNVGRLPNTSSHADLGLDKGETLLAGMKADPEAYLTIGTRNGNVKRIKLADATSSRREGSWGAVIGLADDKDEVIFATLADKPTHTMFFTQGNMQKADPRALRFETDTVNPVVSASAKGVTGIKMRDGAPVLGGVCFNPDQYTNGYLVVVTENGFAKLVKLDEFPVQGRAGQGVMTMKPTKQSGLPVAYAVANEGDMLDLVSEKGKRLRIRVTDIPEQPRSKNGENISAKFDGLFGGEKVAFIAVVPAGDAPVQETKPATKRKTAKAEDTPAPTKGKKAASSKSPTTSKKKAEAPVEKTTKRGRKPAAEARPEQPTKRGRKAKAEAPATDEKPKRKTAPEKGKAEAPAKRGRKAKAQ